MEKRAIVLIFISVFTILLILSSSHVLFAYWESEGGRIYVTGWVENLTSVRLDDRPSSDPAPGYDAGDIQTFRNTLQIETNVKLSSNLDFFAIGRGWWDGSTTLDINDLPDIIEDEHASHRGPDMDGDIDLREWYVTAHAGDFTVKGGRRAAREMLQRPEMPAVMFAINDLMAIGFILELHEAGYTIPDDIAVMGYDNIPEATIIRPTLTTIAQDPVDIGEKLARALLDRIEGRTEKRRVIESHYRLIPRQSA